MTSTTASYLIYTTASSLTIPVIPEMALPTAKNFSWTVRGYGPYSSVDGAADTARLNGVSKYESAGTFHTFTVGGTRNFKTQ
jgi:hypothetical protein